MVKNMKYIYTAGPCHATVRIDQNVTPCKLLDGHDGPHSTFLCVDGRPINIEWSDKKIEPQPEKMLYNL